MPVFQGFFQYFSLFSVFQLFTYRTVHNSCLKHISEFFDKADSICWLMMVCYFSREFSVGTSIFFFPETVSVQRVQKLLIIFVVAEHSKCFSSLFSLKQYAVKEVFKKTCSQSCFLGSSLQELQDRSVWLTS